MKEVLARQGYVLNDAAGVWSRPDYHGIAYNDGDEIEERIAAIVAQADDLSVLSSELARHCTDWPSTYHLSANRANILRPFGAELQGGAQVLEIGAGCGAITRYLGECGSQVLALEGTPRRASIARSRTRDLSNVAVLAESFDRFQTEQRFDIVTLIGVLEYAGMFVSAENPALAMLERARSFLKPGGRLIIAIENQLGLKYFAGAPEDHLGKPMYGVEGRYRPGQPCTWGRVELQALAEQAGFASSELYTPFPDYKLPASVVSTAGLQDPGFDAATLIWQSLRRDPQLPPILAFSPELVWPTLVRNGLGADFANSFLLVAHNGPQTPAEAPPVLAWHYSTGRKKEFCKEARFIRRDPHHIDVHYTVFHPGAAAQAEGPLAFRVPEKDGYAQGRLLSEALIHIICRDGWHMQEVADFLRRYLGILAGLPGAGATAITEATHPLPGIFFDRLPQNIVDLGNGTTRLIDEEWEYQGTVQAGFLVFRLLRNALFTVTRIGKPADDFDGTPLGFIQSAMAAIGWPLDETALQAYMDLEAEIQHAVTGAQVNIDALRAWLTQAALIARNLFDENSLQHERVDDLFGTLAQRDSRIEELSGMVSRQHQHIGHLEGQSAELFETLKERDDTIARLSGDIETQHRHIAHLDSQIADLSATLTERDARVGELSGMVTQMDAHIRFVEQRHEVMLGSLSWRITRPLRWLASRLRGGKS